MKYDICNTCGKESPYTVETHIDQRIGYVEGVGQHCFQPKKCSNQMEWVEQNRAERFMFDVFLLEKEISNDQQFGEKIRFLIYKLKNQKNEN